jgi:hypothetical protein
VPVAIRPGLLLEAVDTDAFAIGGVDHHGLVTERDTFTNRERP